MRKLSYSEASLYEKCSELWYQNYVLNRFPPKPPQFKFGNIVHNSLAHVWYNGLRASVEAITPALFDYSRQPEQDKNLAQKLVVEGIEALKSLNIDYQSSNFFEVEQLIEYDDFKGFLDLNVRSRAHKSHIIDWKTTRENYEQHDILSSDQLTCYAWLYWRKYNELPDYVSYITLDKRSGKAAVYTSIRTYEDIQQWAQKIDFIRHQMDNQMRYKDPKACIDKYGCCSHYKRCWPDRFIKIQAVSPEPMDFIT